MKTSKLVSLTALLLLGLASCKQSIEFEYSGTLIESCDTGTPMANMEVVYEGDWQEFKVRTDENGRFRISGKYKTEGCTMCKEENPRLWIKGLTGKDPVFATFSHNDYNVDLGVMAIHRIEPAALRVRFESDTIVSTSGDTLHVYAVNPQTLEQEEFTITGPFQDGELLDTFYFDLPPHLGYAEYPHISVKFTSNSINSDYRARVANMYGAPNPQCGEIPELEVIIRE